MPYITDLFDAMYDFAEGRRPDFPAKDLFRQFNAAVDIPAPLIPLVLEAYPDAKVGTSNYLQLRGALTSKAACRFLFLLSICLSGTNTLTRGPCCTMQSGVPACCHA